MFVVGWYQSYMGKQGATESENKKWVHVILIKNL
jgi:hypothetical protein